MRYEFQSDVNEMLKLVIHSLYSHHEIFLRELVSNSSDAIEKLQYLTISDATYKDISLNSEIHIYIKEDKLIIEDHGIGMTEEDLKQNLGTLAHSGTKRFLNQANEAKKEINQLIGQFGVGFYSSFMVSSHVEVLSRHALNEKAYLWKSEGTGGYEIIETEKSEIGTTITLHLNEEGKKFSQGWEVKSIIEKYSNHISFPIFLHYEKDEWDAESKKSNKKASIEQINSTVALWTRQKNDISTEEYDEFYKNNWHDTQIPLTYLHTKLEGTLEYTTLFYIPQKRPLDIFYTHYKNGIKLYVKKVFISDENKDLLPPYLRFVRGIIDSQDLPLNVSREILQKNNLLDKIKEASIKKIFSALNELAKNDTKKYHQFIEEFNKVLKEGLYSDFSQQENILDLVRFHSLEHNTWISLQDYIDSMAKDQKSIYYLTGKSYEDLLQSPLLQAYRKRSYDVLLLYDEIDEIVFNMIPEYKKISLKSIQKGDTVKEIESPLESTEDKDHSELIQKLKEVLKEDISDVMINKELVDVPACVIHNQADMSFQMKSMFQAMGQTVPDNKPTLSINPEHPFFNKLALADDKNWNDLAYLLAQEAFLIERIPIKNPVNMVRIINQLMR